MDRSGEEIRTAVEQQLAWDSRVDASKIEVLVTDHRIILSGMVGSYLERQAAEEDAWSMPGVTIVENHLMMKADEPQKSEDNEILWSIRSAFSLNSSLDKTKIEVEVKERIVLLKGSVDVLWKKIKAEELAADVPGVIKVVNTLTVVPTGSPLDQSIAADILAAISRVSDIDLRSLNVVVDGGMVTISGKVPEWSTYSTIYSIVKHTHGVTSIINNLVIAQS